MKEIMKEMNIEERKKKTNTERKEKKKNTETLMLTEIRVQRNKKSNK